MGTEHAVEQVGQRSACDSAHRDVDDWIVGPHRISDQQEHYDDDQTCQKRPEALSSAERRAGVVD